MRTITCRVEDEIDERLERLASETHRTKSFYVREALLKSLDDMENVYLADQVIERIRSGKEETSTLAEVGTRLGLDHLSASEALADLPGTLAPIETLLDLRGAVKGGGAGGFAKERVCAKEAVAKRVIEEMQ